MDTDIKGVSAEVVIRVKPRKELWVNAQRLDAGVEYTVPADFGFLSHCDIIDDVEPDDVGSDIAQVDEKPKRKKKADK